MKVCTGRIQAAKFPEGTEYHTEWMLIVHKYRYRCFQRPEQLQDIMSKLGSWILDELLACELWSLRWLLFFLKYRTPTPSGQNSLSIALSL